MKSYNPTKAFLNTVFIPENIKPGEEIKWDGDDQDGKDPYEMDRDGKALWSLEDVILQRDLLPFMKEEKLKRVTWAPASKQITLEKHDQDYESFDSVLDNYESDDSDAEAKNEYMDDCHDCPEKTHAWRYDLDGEQFINPLEIDYEFFYEDVFSDAEIDEEEQEDEEHEGPKKKHKK
jgi:hypothetical protein